MGLRRSVRTAFSLALVSFIPGSIMLDTLSLHRDKMSSESEIESQPSKRSEIKKLHFQKNQELKKAKSKADKDKIEAKYKELENKWAPQVVEVDTEIPVVPLSLYKDQQEISRAQQKKESKKTKEEAKRQETIAAVGDGSLELELAKNERAAIESRIPAGFHIMETRADGDCMFASLRAHLGDSMTCTEIRNLVADFLIANEDEFKFFVYESDFTVYCNGLRESAWGSQIELEALSRIMERCILVYTPDRIITVGESFKTDEIELLRISFHQRQFSSPHYNAVVPIS